MIAVLSFYASTPNAFTDDHARLLTLLAPSLASSIAALRKVDGWTRPLRSHAARPWASCGC